MEEILRLLQNEIYRLDWQIGVAADELRKTDHGNADWYNTVTYKRDALRNSLRELKALEEIR